MWYEMLASALKILPEHFVSQQKQPKHRRASEKMFILLVHAMKWWLNFGVFRIWRAALHSYETSRCRNIPIEIHGKRNLPFAQFLRLSLSNSFSRSLSLSVSFLLYFCPPRPHRTNCISFVIFRHECQMPTLSRACLKQTTKMPSSSAQRKPITENVAGNVLMNILN